MAPVSNSGLDEEWDDEAQSAPIQDVYTHAGGMREPCVNDSLIVVYWS